MFRKYGMFGIFLIVAAEINFFLKAEPFASWYFSLIWLGFILTIDALIYKLKKNSLISNRFPQFLGMAFASMLIWWIFEFVNISVKNWEYTGLEQFGVWKNLALSLAFATIIPALFETVELIRVIHLFDKVKLKKHNISKIAVHIIIWIGVICFAAPLFIPKFTFPLVWLSFFFILDPINYLHKQPSIIGDVKKGKAKTICGLLLAGILIGFLWEFWNYWAVVKWVYTVPFVGFFKIFEMPILGYLGYFPFAFELYAMYWFARSLFLKKEKLLE